MKKFVSMFSLVMALASVSFVSCSNDDDVIKTIDPQEKPQSTRTSEEDHYLALKFWASDDLLEIADVTCSGLVADYSFTEAMSLTTLADFVVNGKAGALVEAPAENEAKITFTLKEDWRKRVEGKVEINLISAKAEVREKGGEAKFSPFNLTDLIVDVNRATDENMKAVLEMCNYSITIK